MNEDKETGQPAKSPGRTFHAIDESGSEPEVYDRLPASSGESKVNKDDSPEGKAQPKRRPPQPLGRLFDPPCVRCSFKDILCVRDVRSLACIHCYKAKHGCIYGQRRP